MINSTDDEKDKDQAREGQKMESGNTGEGAYSLQRSPSEDLVSEEEVTQEMIEAGCRALSDLGYPDFWYPESHVVKAVYLAMCILRH